MTTEEKLTFLIFDTPECRGALGAAMREIGRRAHLLLNTTTRIVTLLSNMEIGFTSTRRGLAKAQAAGVKDVLSQFVTHARLVDEDELVFRHGACKGGDCEGAHLARELGFWIVGHPGFGVNKKTGKITLDQRGVFASDKEMGMFPYLVRNEHIVDKSQYLVGAPHQKNEVKRGSGTWYTIRYARKWKKPIIIVFPDGTIETENF